MVEASTHIYNVFPEIIHIYNPGQKSKETKQNWPGLGLEICFCVVFDYCYQKFISRRETGH